jgi:hypothetical protein
MRKKLTLGLLALVCALSAFVFEGDSFAQTKTLTARFYVQVTGNYTSALDLVSATAPLSYTKSTDLASGVAANQADRIFTDTRTLTASANEDLDVSGGSLVDAFGATFTIAKLKLLVVCASSSNTNNVVILGDANSVPITSTAATTLAIKPGGCSVPQFDPTLGGITVTAGTGDIIQVANSGAGTSVTYDIVIVGTSS